MVDRQLWTQPHETGRPTEKGKEKGKGKCKSGGKAEGKEKRFACYEYGRIEHTARLRGMVNDWEVRTPMMTAAGPRMMMRHSNFMSSPPELRDVFSEAGWTVVTRKSRNPKQCTKLVTVLGSLWDDDNNLTLVKSLTTVSRKEW